MNITFTLGVLAILMAGRLISTQALGAGSCPEIANKPPRPPCPPCPPCDPEAGCPQPVCPCVCGNRQFDPPPYSLQSTQLGCPDCPKGTNCEAYHIRLACSPLKACTWLQFHTWLPGSSYTSPSCPPCDPEAGCPQPVCPCVWKNQRFNPPPYSLKSTQPGCPDCPKGNNCLAYRVRLACSPLKQCTCLQVRTWLPETS